MGRKGGHGQLRWRRHMIRQWLEDWVIQHLSADKPGGTTGEQDRPCDPGFQCGEIKPQKKLTLAVKTYGGWGSGRNSQLHRRVPWRDPQGPGTYIKQPTRESAPEGPNLLCCTGSDWKPLRAEQAALFPLGPLPHIQHRNTVKWVARPWLTPKAPPLTPVTAWPEQKKVWP